MCLNYHTHKHIVPHCSEALPLIVTVMGPGQGMGGTNEHTLPPMTSMGCMSWGPCL